MNKLLLKIFISISLISLMYLGYTNALDLNQDCYLTIDVGRLENRKGYNNENFPKEDIQRAIYNLKAYCCNNNLLGSESNECVKDRDNGNLLETYPESRFLFSHLLDVGLRRLDANEDLIYPGLSLDPAGKERRNFIRDKGSSKDGTVPNDIVPQFKDYWTINNNYRLENRKDGNYMEMYSNGRNDIYSRYNERPLINRYLNQCEITAYIYGYLGGKLNVHVRGNGYSDCKKMVENISKKNMKYTETIILKKSNKLLYDNINAYTKDYFSNKNLNRLKSLIIGIAQNFSTVNKKIIQLVNQCS